jgi:hypothetical protein
MRIYLDKQIFSHLFKQEKSQYVDLLKKLYDYKSNGIFCYSHAHLLDLKNDKTDIKYDELKFMETLVEDNYLSYHAIDKYTSCYLVKPLEAFADIDIEEEEFDVSDIFNLDTSLMTEEQNDNLAIVKNLFNDFKFDFSFLKENLPEDADDSINKIIPSEKMSIMDLTQHMMSMVKNMEEDKSFYKGLRGTSDKYLNNGKFTVDFNSIDFNDDLKNSALQKTFIEFVNGNLNPNGNKKVTRYDFFTNAYFSLDLLGISKEPAKTVKFRNVLNDGFHSYYGAYCDYVISDDNGFLKKTKALYKLLKIDTKVLHIDEFINSFSFSIDNEEICQDTFFSLLINDIKNGLIVNSKKSLQFNRETITFKSNHNYLGNFNRIDQMIQDNVTYLYLYKEIKNYSNFTFFKEYEIVINNAVKIFGADTNFKGNFNWSNELKEIEDSTWKGRFWDFKDFTILIDINKGTENLGLQLTVK